MFNQILRKLAVVLLSMIGLVLLGQAPASASLDAETGSNPCGGSYSLVGTHHMYKPGTSIVKGNVQIYWNGTRNCGIAECYTNCGQTLYREIFIRRIWHFGWEDSDAGYFQYYAGPVYTGPSAGTCIVWDAAFYTSAPPGGTLIASDEGSGHCG